MIDRINEVRKEIRIKYEIFDDVEAYNLATEIVKIEMLDRRLNEIGDSLDRIYKEV